MSLPSNGEQGVDLTDRRVLVVEDDATVAEVAVTYLRTAGLLADVASDSFSALAAVERTPPDLIVLDRMLPGIDGAEVCRRIRATSAVPIIMLTALGSTEDRIAGLEAGADDYLTKPFSPRELVLRVQSVLRRSLAPHTPEAPFDIGPFHLDASARRVSRDGTELVLSAREFDLLAFLLKHPRQTFDRQTLLRSVWGWEFGDLSTVTVTTRRLREKIEADPAHPTLLVTVWGVGYRLDIEET
ncbi:response regulator [Microbacterium sp. 2216-1]|uniref:response regulator transcription factor n=1 Tax=Microbacterium TaxID=33882 RepID=UPI0015CEC3B4|nr:response regulator transcription factor [Microbacterium esteraromaticum]MBN7793810.1 response regulator transcription factor [Microbacterium esteraromaticum]MBN8424681.1 response regulator transcription factor [Microbacterium esteraromaticum]MCA1306888.1 response regulator transcription factor [Microbacterium esteraromaticum]